MYSTNVNLFYQRQTVVLLVGNSPRRYPIVYAKTLKLHKGVDNVIQFQMINQEQKPVDITGKEITFRFIDRSGSEILLQKTLDLTLPLKGLCELRVGSADLEPFDAQLGSYSLEIPVNEFNVPVFVDAQAGARGDLQLCDSVFPKFIPSEIVTIPSHVQPGSNANVTFYSSNINTLDQDVLSIQPYYDSYTGNVVIQGSTIPDADWYTIDTVDIANTVTTQIYNVVGFHPYVRLQFNCTEGDVTKVLAR